MASHCLALCLAVLVPLQNDGQNVDVAGLIAKLGHPELVERNRASAELLKNAESALPALHLARQHSDPEVATRAKEILDEHFQRPITNDPQLARIWGNLKSPNPSSRRGAVGWLADHGHIERVFWLIERETDEEMRKSFQYSLTEGLEQAFAKHIVKGDFAAARSVLPLLDVRRYGAKIATFLAAQGEATKRIAELRRQPGLDPKSSDGQLLRWLLRITGDTSQLADLAAEDPESEWSQAVPWLSRNWRTLSELHAQATPGENELETRLFYHWGRAVAFARGGNDLPASAAAIKQIEATRVSIDNRTSIRLAQVWIQLGDLERAVKTLETHNPSALALLRWQQGNYREALQALNLKSRTPTAVQQWLKAQDVHDEYISLQNPAHPLERVLLAAQLMHAIGETKLTADLLAAARKSRADKPERIGVLTSIFETEFALGHNESAERHYEEFLQLEAEENSRRTSNNTGRLRVIHATGLPHPDIDGWFSYFVEHKKSPDSPAVAIRKAHQILFPRYEPRMSDADWQPILEARAREHQHDPTSFDLQLVANAYLTRGKLAEALRVYEAVAPRRPVNAPPGIAQQKHRYANGWEAARMLVEHERWAEVIAALREHLQTHREAGAWWLLAHALRQQGDLPAAEQTKQTARLLSLEATGSDLDNAQNLLAWGCHDWAQELIEANLRLIGYQTIDERTAHEMLAQILRLREPELALQHHYLRTAYVLHPRRYFDWQKALSAAQSLLGAVAAVEHGKGQRAQALKTWNQAIALMPLRATFVSEQVAWLTAANDADSAAKVFEAAYQQLAASAKEFPRAANVHRALAQLAAGCRRRLPEGAKHAQLALDLQPEDAAAAAAWGAILAEQGDRSGAIEKLRQAVGWNPRDAAPRRALKQLQAAAGN